MIQDPTNGAQIRFRIATLTTLIDIALSWVIMVLFFSTENSIEILTWILKILYFSIEITDIELSEVIFVLK